MGSKRAEVLRDGSRRRGYTEAEKSRMVAEAFRPGVVVLEAARRLGVDVSLLYRWRRHSRVTPAPAPGFLMIADTTCEPGARVASEVCKRGRSPIFQCCGVGD